MRYYISRKYGKQDLFFNILKLLIEISLKPRKTEEKQMAKYTSDIKEKAVVAAKTGMHLKEIQRTIGPNPKATLRYLAKLGIDYKKLVEQLKAQGKGPQTTVQISKQKADAKAAVKTNSPQPVVKPTH